MKATKQFEKQGREACGMEDDESDDSGMQSVARSDDDMHTVTDEEQIDKEYEDAIEELMDDLATKGIFSVRCGAHSLQLVLKDFDPEGDPHRRQRRRRDREADRALREDA